MESVIYEDIYKYSDSKLKYHLDQIHRYTNEYQKIFLLNLLNKYTMYKDDGWLSFTNDTPLFNPDIDFWERVKNISNTSQKIDLHKMYGSYRKDFITIQNTAISRYDGNSKFLNNLDLIDYFYVTHPGSPNYILPQVFHIGFNLQYKDGGDPVEIEGVYKNPKAQVNYIFKQFISYINLCVSNKIVLFNSDASGGIKENGGKEYIRLVAGYLLTCVNIIKTETFTLESDVPKNITKCPLCDHELEKRKSVFGYFRSCTNEYCKYTTSLKLTNRKLLSLKDGV